MPEASSRKISPWIAFVAGVVAMLAVALAVFAWSHRTDAADGLNVTLHDTPSLPSLPHLPQVPKLPDPPIVKPQ